MDIEIRKAIPEDAHEITSVFYRTWLDTYPNEEFGIIIDDVEDKYKDAFTEEKINIQKQRIANPNGKENRIVAVYENKIVGISNLVRNEDNNQLKTIYILPEYQNKGIGKMLWNEVKKYCDPGKDTIVQVATYNTNAIEFYKKLGFVDTGKRFTDEHFRMKSGAVLPEMEMIIKAE